jgi:UMP-CMP kinase
MANGKLEVVFVLGSLGSGKGTVCKKIEEEFGYVHVSAGQLLRQERTKADSPYRDLINKHYREGSMVPSGIMCTLLEKAVAQSKSTKFLFDAFPVNMDNLNAWHNSALSNKMTLSFVLFLECPQAECKEGIQDRSAAGSGRVDDVKAKLGNRFTRYEEETFRVVSHFREGGLLREVDARKSPDEVYREVRGYFQRPNAIISLGHKNH